MDNRISDLKRRKKKTTICTPLYQMTRENNGASSVLGHITFFVYLISVFACMVCLFFIAGSELLRVYKIICAMVAIATFFILTTMILFIDIVTSIEERIGKYEEYLSSIDESCISICAFLANSIKDAKRGKKW